MKVIEKGRSQKGWAIESACTGQGNGGGGCGAKLLVEKNDVYQTEGGSLGETEYYWTFICPECHVETDLKDVPNRHDIPRKGEWLKRREALKAFTPVRQEIIEKAATKILSIVNGSSSHEIREAAIKEVLLEFLSPGS